MKYIKMGFIILIILGLIFVGYKGYLAYQKWQEPKVETVKTIIEPLPDKTYEGLKEQVIELKKDEETNKDEIKILREELSIQRKAFLASDDTIYIKDTEGNKYLLYRDIEGNLQAGSDNIAKIIEHRDVPILVEEELMINKTTWDIKAGGYYSLIEREYGLILSREILGIKQYSLNISLLSDLKDFEGFNLGANLNYEIKSDLELGVGITVDKNYFVVLEYNF